MNSRFQALKSKNLLWYFFGQGSSLFGSWLQYIALGWFTYNLTGSPTLLGIVSLLGGLPILILPPLIGGMIDRFNKKTLLLITQNLFFLQAIILALLTIYSYINYPLILILSIIHGIIFSFDQPLKQALIPSFLANNEDLPNAIAWNAFLNNLIRIIAPLIAGLIIAQYGEGICFLIDAMSFGIMIFTIFQIKWKDIEVRNKKFSFWKAWRVNLNYLASMKIILHALMFAFLFSSTIGTYTVMMPIIAQSVYNGNASTQGYLLAASGIGAVFGSLFMTKQDKNYQKGIINTIFCSTLISVSALFVLVHSSSLERGLIASLILGANMLIGTISLATLLQLSVDDDKRGVVMSFFTTAYLGSIPLSNFTAGLLTEHLGIKTAMNILAIICVLGVLFYFIVTFLQDEHPLLRKNR